MATPFTDVYSRAIFKFADKKFLTKDIETREGVLEKFLLASIVDFQRVSKIDISDYDEDLKQFNHSLNDEIIEILALGTAVHWLSFKALDSDLLKNVLNSKDYYYYSPGNLLKEVQTLRKTLSDEYDSKIRQYSYYDNTLSTLRN